MLTATAITAIQTQLHRPLASTPQPRTIVSRSRRHKDRISARSASARSTTTQGQSGPRWLRPQACIAAGASTIATRPSAALLRASASATRDSPARRPADELSPTNAIIAVEVRRCASWTKPSNIALPATRLVHSIVERALDKASLRRSPPGQVRHVYGRRGRVVLQDPIKSPQLAAIPASAQTTDPRPAGTALRWATTGEVDLPATKRMPANYREWAMLGSNQRPPPCRDGALPAELIAREDW